MMENASEKKLRVNFQSVRSKVIGGFLLSGAALVLFWLGSRFVFGATLQNMESLSKPNDKLLHVHNLFQDFTRIDQLQRHIAVEDKPNRQQKITALSDTLQNHVKHLKHLYKTTDTPYQHLESIEQVMKKRSRLLWDFIRERDHLTSNSLLTTQIQAISGLIADNGATVDSNLLSETYRMIEKTSTSPDTLVKIISLKRQGNIFNRLFGKKKPVIIEENYAQGESEMAVEKIVDSVSNNLVITRKDTILPRLEAQLHELVHYHQQQSARMVSAELAFLKASNALTGEILFLLYQIEEEELANIEANQSFLSKLINKSFGMFNWLLIGILLTLAFLTFLILTDFSKSRRFRSQLIEAREEAERLSRVKERFLSNMSHEIRTPLQSIIGYAEHILKIKQPSDLDKQAIHQSARHLLQIVNEILDYNRLVSGQFQLDAQPFDLRGVLEETSAIMKVQAEAKGLTFCTRFNPESGYLLSGDAFRLRQILYNLLGNAIKYTDQGSVSLSANMQSDETGCRVQLLIKDSGIGISQTGLKQIFNEFEQVAGLDRERYGGAGLGLSIVKTLVEMQGGEIQVESKPGAGSLFSVNLHYPKVEAGVFSVENASRFTPETATKGRAGTVYLVDDDAYTLRLCQRILESNEFQVIAFSDAADLLNATVFQAEDVVLTDLRLPGMSGYQLLNKLREGILRVSTIAMTAQALPKEQQAIRKAGFDEILVKPFTADELIRVVSRFVKSVKKEEPPLFSSAFEEEGEGLHELFIEESGKDLKALATAMEISDPDQVVSLLHRLAGRCGQFGYTAWYQTLRRLEIRLRRNTDLQTCSAEIENLCEEMNGTLARSDA